MGTEPVNQPAPLDRHTFFTQGAAVNHDGHVHQFTVHEDHAHEDLISFFQTPFGLGAIHAIATMTRDEAYESYMRLMLAIMAAAELENGNELDDGQPDPNSDNGAGGNSPVV